MKALPDPACSWEDASTTDTFLATQPGQNETVFFIRAPDTQYSCCPTFSRKNYVAVHRLVKFKSHVLPGPGLAQASLPLEPSDSTIGGLHLFCW